MKKKTDDLITNIILLWQYQIEIEVVKSIVPNFRKS